MAEKLLRFKDILEMDGGTNPLSRPQLSFNDLHTTQYRPGEDELTNYRAYRRRRVGDVGSDTATYSESTDAYGKSTQAIADKRKKDAMSSSDKDKLGKLAAMMAKEKKPQKEGFFDSIGDTRDRVRKAKASIAKGMDKITAMQKYRVTPKDLAEDNDVDEALTVQQRLARKRTLRRIQPKIKLGRERAKRRMASKEKLMRRTRKQVRAALLKKLTKNVPKGDLTYARRQELEKRLEKPSMKRRIEMLAKKAFPKVRQAELAKKRGGKK